MIRIASTEDAADVARLLIAFRDWQGRAEPGDAAFEAGARRLLANDDTEFLLAGSPAAGVCQLRYRYGIWRDGLDCCLEDLFVAEEARGSGLGRALAEAAIRRARERGCVRVHLDVDESNPPALALYESLGFRSTDGAGGRNLFMRLVL